MTLNISLSGVVHNMRALVLLCVYQHTKFDMPSFIDSKDTIGAKFKKRVT